MSIHASIFDILGIGSSTQDTPKHHTDKYWILVRNDNYVHFIIYLTKRQIYTLWHTYSWRDFFSFSLISSLKFSRPVWPSDQCHIYPRLLLFLCIMQVLWILPNVPKVVIPPYPLYCDGTFCSLGPYYLF